MNLTGYEVQHKAFGQGVVLRADEKYVTVKFASMEKTFVYPGVFNGFMQVSDPEAAKEVEADLARSLAAKEQKDASRAEERERQMRTGIVIPGNRAALERALEGNSRREEPEEQE